MEIGDAGISESRDRPPHSWRDAALRQDLRRSRLACPEKERSGVLGVGKGKLDGLLSVGDVLTVAVAAEGKVHLR